MYGPTHSWGVKNSMILLLASSRSSVAEMIYDEEAKKWRNAMRKAETVPDYAFASKVEIF